MQARIGICLTAIALIAAALPGREIARAAQQQYPYILVDLGTFGGPQSFMAGLQIVLNNRGMVVGNADTAIPEPNFNPLVHFSQDPLVQHAFVWQKGTVTDLGAQLGRNSNSLGWINAGGDAAGAAETGSIDPLMGFPAQEAILWKGGHAILLGGLGGYEGGANAVNDRDQVAGATTNAVPDPFSFFSLGTQMHAFLWQNGVMRDLGTLGGPDSFATVINNRGQVAGSAYTNATPNPATGVPPIDPFLWQQGKMQDLGTLGGTQGFVNTINEMGLVAGQSNMAGDQTFHPFLWDGRTLRDLGTLGGDYGAAVWMNEAGTIAGWATTSGNTTVHTVLWRDGAIRDLEVPPGDDYSFAQAIDTAGQVVGNAGAFGVMGHGFLWDHGAMADVNTLVAPSDLHVTEAEFVNDRGEIAGNGVLPDGRQRAVLLVPATLAAADGIASNAPAIGTITPAAAMHAAASRCPAMPPWRARFPHALPLPCLVH